MTLFSSSRRLRICFFSFSFTSILWFIGVLAEVVRFAGVEALPAGDRAARDDVAFTGEADGVDAMVVVDEVAARIVVDGVDAGVVVGEEVAAAWAVVEALREVLAGACGSATGGVVVVGVSSATGVVGVASVVVVAGVVATVEGAGAGVVVAAGAAGAVVATGTVVAAGAAGAVGAAGTAGGSAGAASAAVEMEVARTASRAKLILSPRR